MSLHFSEAADAVNRNSTVTFEYFIMTECNEVFMNNQQCENESYLMFQ